MKKLTVIILMLFAVVVATAEQDFCTTAMESTFKLTGNGPLGTCFIVGKPVSDDKLVLQYVLVTAKHVLRDLKDSKVVIHLRKKAGNKFERVPFELEIRKKDKPLWIEHPTADVALMYVSLPKGIHISLISTELFATDDMLKEFEIRPGDQLFALGYPFGLESNEEGFPILRAGTIASYPLLPSRDRKTFLLDFEIYGGNSGGPVLFVSYNRIYGGGMRPGTINFIMGLVSSEKVLKEKIITLKEETEKKHSLKIAQIVHASMIREMINKLQKK